MGAHVAAAVLVGATELPKKSSNLWPPVNMERLVVPPSVASGEASTGLLLPGNEKTKLL